MMESLAKLGLLAEVHPSLVWDPACRQNLEMMEVIPEKPLSGIKLELDKGNNLRKLAYILWMVNQPVEKTQVILRRLRYPATQVNAVIMACKLWKDLPWIGSAKLSQIASRLEDVPPLAIYANFLAARDDKICANFQAYMNRLRKITPRITGDELRRLGLPPGPIYKRILGALRDAWLDGKIENIDQEEAYLHELIKNEASVHPAG